MAAMSDEHEERFHQVYQSLTNDVRKNGNLRYRLPSARILKVQNRCLTKLLAMEMFYSSHTIYRP